MTAHNDSVEQHDLRVGGRPLSVTIAKHRRALVAGALDDISAAIPLYAALPPEQMASDIAMAVERGLRLFLTLLATGRDPRPDELDEVRTSAAQRAEEGVPLAMVLEAYLVGARSIVAGVAALAEPDEIEDLATAFGLALQMIGAASRTAVEGYVTEDRMIATAALEERRALLADLLAGRLSPADRMARPTHHAVIHLVIGRHPDEDDPSGAAGVAARRKVRRVTTALAGDDELDLLSSLAPQGGLAVVTADDHQKLTDLLDTRLEAAAAAAEAPLTSASVISDVDGVPAAAHLATELTHLAITLGRPPGHYRLDDLLVEHQLTRPGPARKALAARLDPLADRPELVETLRVHLASGANRRSTAANLRMHPNSVDHRLRRVAQLTGLDIGDPVGALDTRAALLAWDAERRDAADGRG